EILHELKPQMKRVAFLGNHAVPPERIAFNQLQVTARALGMEAAFFDVAVLGGIEPAFVSIVQSGMDVMSCANSPTLLEQSKQIIELAASSDTTRFHHAAELPMKARDPCGLGQRSGALSWGDAEDYLRSDEGGRH